MKFLEIRLGLKLKPPPPNTRDPNAMDLGVMARKPCKNCGKAGHTKETRWAPDGGANRPGGKGGQSQGWNPFPSGHGNAGKNGGEAKGKGNGHR